MRIGFGGLGRMGRRMAVNLGCAGHDLQFWNRTEQTAIEIADRTGGRHVSPVAELGRGVDVVLTMIADDKTARRVCLGPSGLIAGPSGSEDTAKGAMKLAVNMPIRGMNRTSAEALPPLIGQLLLIDDLAPHGANNPVWCTYGPAPNAAYLIASDGEILAAHKWLDPVTMAASIRTLVGE